MHNQSLQTAGMHTEELQCQLSGMTVWHEHQIDRGKQEERQTSSPVFQQVNCCTARDSVVLRLIYLFSFFLSSSPGSTSKPTNR